jgi:hypothetical protein
MIPIESQVAHSLGQDVATERMHQLVASLAQRFPQQVHQVQLDLREQRVHVSFAAYGYVVKWQAEINEEAVILHGQIPDAARPFRNKIEQVILARVEDTLVPGAARAA